MTTKLQNGTFVETNTQTFATAFGSPARDRQSLVARRTSRMTRRANRAL